MQTAYKCFQIGNAIAFIFEEPPAITDDIGFVRDERRGNLLVFGGRCEVLLSQQIVNLLSSAEGIYYAQSRKEDLGVVFTAFVPLDRLVIGKILAFCELD